MHYLEGNNKKAKRHFSTFVIVAATFSILAVRVAMSVNSSETDSSSSHQPEDSISCCSSQYNSGISAATDNSLRSLLPASSPCCACAVPVSPESAVLNLSYSAQADYFASGPDNLIDFYLKELNHELLYDPDNVHFRDQVIIPDKKNTGIEADVKLKTFDESGYIGTISAEDAASGKKPLFLAVKKGSFYNINGYANSKCSSQVVIDGYNFEDVRLYTTNDFKFPSETVIIFKNCKFNNIGSYSNEKLWIVLDHCQTEGNISGNNIIIKNCYMHSNNRDALNPNRNVIVKDTYIADLYRSPSSQVTHIDGVQIFGDQYGGISENIILDNVRFSIPQISYGNSKTYVNAAIATGLEFSEGRNFLFKDIIIDSGGRWYPIYNTGGDSVLYKNIQVANGYGHIFYTGYYNPNATVKNVELSDGLYVTSVWKDKDNKTHFLCSNNNTQTDKVLKVVTNQKDYTFHIDRHPTPKELCNDPVFSKYRFKDLPYDIEFVINEDIKFATFFDGDRQIRSITF